MLTYGHTYANLRSSQGNNTQSKGDKNMRTISYAIYKKGTNERVYANANYAKVNEIMGTLENKDNYEIRYKWFSI